MFVGLSGLRGFTLSPRLNPQAHKHTSGHRERTIPQAECGFDSDIFLNGTTLAVLDLSYLNVRREKASVAFQMQVLPGVPVSGLKFNSQWHSD